MNDTSRFGTRRGFATVEEATECRDRECIPRARPHNAAPREEFMLETTIAGSLPKPGWLAETNKLWPTWRASGAALAQAKRDATLLWLKEQEDAGIDVV